MSTSPEPRAAPDAPATLATPVDGALQGLITAALAADAPGIAALCERAAALRDRAWGRTLTFSPKVFLPVTNLCRNACSYCSFYRRPKDAGAHTMAPDELTDVMAAAREQGCVEALLCLGDTPEAAFPSYRDQLGAWGHRSTVDYLVWAGQRALELGLLPHTNAGILTADEMARLRPVNVSLGLMLETTAERLCDPGGPHARAPDKRPERRLAMTRAAGELAIPFTSGLLVGIGETRRERLDALLTLRALHAEHGHLQELIIQPFRPHAGTRMAATAPPPAAEVMLTIALARLVMPAEVSVQAPPNLMPIADMVRAGVNDLGGISPLTPDFINPGHPWPHLDRLGEALSEVGFELRPRLPIYDAWLARPGFLDDALRAPVAAAASRLGRGLPGAEVAA